MTKTVHVLQDAFDGRPFMQLLEQQGLDRQLRHVLLHAVALSPWNQDNSSSAQGIA